MNIEELNKELFQQLIALGSSDGEQLKEEISKSNAMANIARTIIENNRSAIEACEIAAEYGLQIQLPEFIKPAVLSHVSK